MKLSTLLLTSCLVLASAGVYPQVHAVEKNLSTQLSQPSDQKNRLVVLSDIEADPDDSESFIRLLLYANEIDIKGLIATTSVWMKTSVSPESINRLIKAYGKVQANLNKHQQGFPDAGLLLSKVKHGIPAYGMEGIGDGKDSEGSDWIIKLLEENDNRPLWISVWGGVNTLGQSLFSYNFV